MSDIRASAALIPSHPLIQALEEYLKGQSSLPPVRGGNLPPGTHGLFRYGEGLPSSGEIVLSPEADSAAYGHELTHAADWAMRSQFQAQIPGQDQFQDAYKKIIQNGSLQSQALRLSDPKSPMLT